MHLRTDSRQPATSKGCSRICLELAGASPPGPIAASPSCASISNLHAGQKVAQNLIFAISIVFAITAAKRSRQLIFADRHVRQSEYCEYFLGLQIERDFQFSKHYVVIQRFFLVSRSSVLSAPFCYDETIQKSSKNEIAALLVARLILLFQPGADLVFRYSVTDLSNHSDHSVVVQIEYAANPSQDIVAFHDFRTLSTSPLSLAPASATFSGIASESVGTQNQMRSLSSPNSIVSPEWIFFRFRVSTAPFTRTLPEATAACGPPGVYPLSESRTGRRSDRTSVGVKGYPPVTTNSLPGSLPLRGRRGYDQRSVESLLLGGDYLGAGLVELPADSKAGATWIGLVRVSNVGSLLSRQSPRPSGPTAVSPPLEVVSPFALPSISHSLAGNLLTC